MQVCTERVKELAVESRQKSPRRTAVYPTVQGEKSLNLKQRAAKSCALGVPYCRQESVRLKNRRWEGAIPYKLRAKSTRRSTQGRGLMAGLDGKCLRSAKTVKSQGLSMFQTSVTRRGMRQRFRLSVNTLRKGSLTSRHSKPFETEKAPSVSLGPAFVTVFCSHFLCQLQHSNGFRFSIARSCHRAHLRSAMNCTVTDIIKRDIMGRNEVVPFVLNCSTLLRVIQCYSTGVGSKHLQMILINAVCTTECGK